VEKRISVNNTTTYIILTNKYSQKAGDIAIHELNDQDIAEEVI